MSYPACGGTPPPTSRTFNFAGVGDGDPVVDYSNVATTLVSCSLDVKKDDRIHVEGFVNAVYNDGDNDESVFSLVYVEGSLILASAVVSPSQGGAPAYATGAPGWTFIAAGDGTYTFSLVAVTTGAGTTGSVGGRATPGAYASIRVKNEGPLPCRSPSSPSSPPSLA